MRRMHKPLFVIGDIHGCLSELLELLLNHGDDENEQLVFIGDYIDRGPDSFAHAGIEPFMDDWQKFDCLWIRDKFHQNPTND